MEHPLDGVVVLMVKVMMAGKEDVLKWGPKHVGGGIPHIYTVSTSQK
jgi:hypothetical protein